MTDRRYNEEEVAAIFKQAAETQLTPQGTLPSGGGMTLAELQEIGREVGLAPELVVQAAKAFDQPASSTSRQFLGLPIGVGRTVDLDRRLTEEEWERLVVDLRETFDARGTVRHEGSFRQWTNGNLQVLLEPTPTGHRVRLRTVRGDSRGLIIVGLGMLGVGAATSIAAVLGGASANLAAVAPMGIIGVGLFIIGAVRLPGWAQTRRRQMEAIVLRLTARS